MATAEQAAEVVVEEVANNLEEAATVVRTLNPKSIAFLAGGLVIGAGIGFVIGRHWRKEKAIQEAYVESEKEVQKIREYYARTEKPSLEDVIEEKGYDESQTKAMERPLPPPVPIIPEAEQGELQKVAPDQVIKKLTHRTVEAEKDKHDGWSYPYELSQRNFAEPHIIHQDEFATNETEYMQTSYLYYAGDDVLVDTDNTVLHNRENLIGTRALNKFGHGSDDRNYVFVRNPEIELEIEIIRLPGRYDVEVQGLDDSDETDDVGE
jgi:hypothetical protein